MIAKKNPRYWGTIACAVAFSLLIVPSLYGTTVERIVATVDDHVITFSDYRVFYRSLYGAEAPDTVDERVLRLLIEEKLIAREAKRRGIEVTDSEIDRAIEAFMTEHNLTPEDVAGSLEHDGIDANTLREIVSQHILASRIMSTDVDARIVISEREIEEFYEAQKRRFIDQPEYVELKGIFLLLRENASLTEITDMKRRALRIATMLRDGDDFERLVAEYSDEPLRSHRGLLGKFTRGALIPPLDQRAFSMKSGEISDPIWVGDGVFILQLVNRAEETYKPIDEVRGIIYDTLFAQKRERIFNEWIKTLWEKSSVTIHRG